MFVVLVLMGLVGFLVWRATLTVGGVSQHGNREEEANESQGKRQGKLFDHTNRFCKRVSEKQSSEVVVMLRSGLMLLGKHEVGKVMLKSDSEKARRCR